MKIRDLLNQNSSIGILAAVVLLVISLFIIYRELTGGSSRVITEQYFYDLNTGRVFVGPTNVSPPIETRSGPYEGEPAGVLAQISTCGECLRDYAGMSPEEVEEAGARIMYLYKERMPESEEEMSPEEREFGPIPEQLYRGLYDERWFSMEEQPAEVMELSEQMLDCPEDVLQRQCLPGRK